MRKKIREREGERERRIKMAIIHTDNNELLALGFFFASLWRLKHVIVLFGVSMGDNVENMIVNPYLIQRWQQSQR